MPQYKGNQGTLCFGVSLYMLTLSCKLLGHGVHYEASGTFEMKLLQMILSETFMVSGMAQLVVYYTEMHTCKVL